MQNQKHCFMKEEFLYYLWENRLLSKDLVTSDGDSVCVMAVGNRNYDSGPDFLDARIRIGGTLWVGHVEIHVNASDWFRHGHQNDGAYKNVILHVVYRNDDERLSVPTVEVSGKFDWGVYERYEGFLKSRLWVPCEKMIAGIQQFTWLSWLERVVVERLEAEVKDVFAKLAANNYDWEETMYQRVMRYSGLKVNNEAFERLSKILPLRILRKHIDNATQIEAVFFGCAGFLEQDFVDGYPVLLQREYKMLKSKFGLVTMPTAYWKFLRLRPPNFPTIRLAQMASLVRRREPMFSKLLELGDLASIRTFFDVDVNEYWKSHFLFDRPSKERNKSLGATAVDLLVINAVVPVLFSYGIYRDDQELKNRSLGLLNIMEPEDNIVIRRFIKMGVNVGNAKQTQALLHLYNNYCKRRKCLKCRVFAASKM